MKRNRLTFLFLTLVTLGCLSPVVVAPCAVIYADDETSVEAEVTVNEVSQEVYGARVMAFRKVWFPRLTIGKPDRFGALFYQNGWIEIKLENTADDCAVINIWAANFGWFNSRFSIYMSANGKKWKHAGNIKLDSPTLARYSLTGDYGRVGYIKVSRSGSRWSFGVLDAVSVKGGD